MYKAITDRIIVRLNDYPQQQFFALPAQTPRNRGTVIDVGSGVCEVKVGDEIIFRAFEELPLPQKDLVAIREKSVLGIIGSNFRPCSTKLLDAE